MLHLVTILLVLVSLCHLKQLSGLGTTKGSDGPALDLPNEHLIQATSKGLLAEVKKALSKGANVNIKDPKTGNSALMWAAKQGHTQIVRYLLSKKADVRALSVGHTQSALLWAVFSCHLQIIDILLSSGAGIEDENGRGDTPLVLAAYLGSPLLGDLLDRGANIDHMTKSNGYTALHMAVFKGHIEAVNVLLSRGADPTVRDLSERTPLMLAAIQGHLAILQTLIDASDETVDALDSQGHSALALAVLYGHQDCAVALVTSGAESDLPITQPIVQTAHGSAAISDHLGDNPLLIAVKQGQLEMVRALLLLGLDHTVKDRHGKSAKEVAKDMGLQEVYALLLSFEVPEL